MGLRIGTSFFVQFFSLFLMATSAVVPLFFPADNATALVSNSDSTQAFDGDAAKLHAQTCRWTNRNQDCAVGFAEVPRLGGRKGEMISDHIQCGGNGRSKFCCPAAAKNLECYWTGINTTGKCKEDCSTNAFEVGRTSAGCFKSGYQRACCKRVDPMKDGSGIEAYGHCGWYSSQVYAGNRELCSDPEPKYDCPGHTPNRLVSSNLGFGGETKCSIGTKRVSPPSQECRADPLLGKRSFCCSNNMPPIFKNCKWKRLCAESEMRWALYNSSEGEQSWCCAGEVDPASIQRVNEFKRLVDL